MSYILDALKKSEQERSRGTIPDIKTIHHPRPLEVKKSSHWPYILMIVLLLNAGGLGFWIYQQNRPAADSSASGDAVVALTESPSIDNLQSIQQTLHGSPQKRQNPPTQDITSPNADNGVRVSPASQENPQKPEARLAAKPNVIFSDEPLSVSEMELKNADTLEDSTAVSDVQIIPQTAFSVAEASTPINEKVYDIAELPEAVKRALPAISFAGHVYSSKQSQRSVMLNGKKMREGQEVTKGLLLEEITVEGVVLRAQGYRFTLGALQDWSFQ